MAENKVYTGKHVELELQLQSGESERMAFDIVPDAQADYPHGFLGEGTPLAKAILGKAEGSSVPYGVADIAIIRILSVSPSVSRPPADAAEKREAILRKAVEDAERMNAITFASSFSGKWGDYDPDGIEKWGEDEK